MTRASGGPRRPRPEPTSGAGRPGGAARPARSRGRGRARAHGRSLAGWAALAPAGLWLGAFFVVPVALVAQYSFATRDLGIARVVLPWTLDAYRLAVDPAVLPIFWRTAAYSLSATLACLVIGLPLAWFVARHAGRWRLVLLGAVLVPFWASHLARIYAWKALLAEDGPVNRVLGLVGLDRPGGLLLTDVAVVVGLTYGYLPFMVLPLYVVCRRFDPRLLEASQDLGHGRLGTFVRVVLPGLAPGVVAGSLLVLVPSVGDFVTPALLGGVNQLTFGSVIDDQFRGGNNWPLGSALAVLLLAAVAVLWVARGRRAREVL
ncbi:MULTISPECIES: ABC transporter permease [Actinoalloteichus]|uniref:ABC transporter permease n=1 Tax=Actinoalloteichus TaxID=65496 RepID=UPI001FDFF3DC|nr:ABC transporter permease [Actinoalloteichus caeruleus]